MSENTQPRQNQSREKKFILHTNANDVKKLTMIQYMNTSDLLKNFNLVIDDDF